ncbi:MAG: adenylate/guanylate cyclase domain-containing protein [candidate division NC10 bacterium]
MRHLGAEQSARKGVRRAFLIGAAVAVWVIVLSLLLFLEVAELKALDVRFYIRGAQLPTSPIVIVAIDEASFDEIYQPWAWPRKFHAQLLKQIAKGHPLVVGVDVLFLEPSPYGAEDDRTLRLAIAEAGNVVLAGVLTLEEGDFFTKFRLNLPLPSLRRAASGYGIANFPLDADGAIRRGSLTSRFRGDAVPHFVDALLSAGRVKAHLGLSRLQGDGDFWINFRGPAKTYPTISYYRVFNGEIDPEVFRDKIVLIGLTAKTLQDVHHTPFSLTASRGSRAPHLWERLYELVRVGQSRGEMLSGVEVQANVAETVLRGIPLRRPPVLFHLAILLLLTLPICYLTAALRGYKALWAYLSLAIGYTILNLALFSALDLWLDLVSPLLSLTLAYASISVNKYVSEERQRHRTRALFGRYVSPDVVREILDSPEGAGLGCRRRKITVLFSDIRGFTTISEQLPPEDVISLLSEYLSRVTDIILLHGGTVDKFIGDAVMALFGAPIQRDDDAVRAVRTALAMTRLVQELSPKWEARCGRPLRIGVGLNTGEAVVGNIGSELRTDYTAIGDVVNLASRLEGLTKELGVPIVVSETTCEEARGEFRLRPIREVFVKGRAVAVKVYTLEEEGGADLT